MSTVFLRFALIGVFVLGFGFGLAGCEPAVECDSSDPDCTAGTSNNNHNGSDNDDGSDNDNASHDDSENDNENESDTDRENGQEDENTNENGDDDDGPAFAPYRYVMIVDQEDPGTSSASSTAGADIDAVELVSGGSVSDATQIENCWFGDGDNSAATNCSDALGAPDNGCSPDAPDFVSLGGSGGILVVSFGPDTEIFAGDVIIIYECGRDQNPGATDEHYDVWVGVSSGLDEPDYVQCMADGTGIAQCTVPTLPQVPVE